MFADKIKTGIAGTGQRAAAYVHYLSGLDETEITALCDVDEDRLQGFARAKELDQVKCYTQISEMLKGDRVDAVIITVPDRFHREVAEACFKAGKHVLLEKPMALTVGECKAIIRAKEAAGRVLQIGFVLRSTPFYGKIKEILDNGTLGQVMSISAAEHLSVGHSISYMRRWHRKKANAGSFLLAKCSHDLDIMNWLTGGRVIRVASFGDLNFFMPGKQPATHCSQCPEMDACEYRFDGGFVFMTETDQQDPSRHDFDLCVFNDDKDIVDNQVCILEYDNQVRAQFSLQLFYPGLSNRTITVTGTKAYLMGDFNTGTISVHYSADKHIEEYDVSAKALEGHGGGDPIFIREFFRAIGENREPVADLRDGFASTVAANAIEEARIKKEVVAIDPGVYEL
jgi:predicted dehydrogenase